jgi:hypothetical protein
MKRVVGLATLAWLAACSDAPVQPSASIERVAVQPQLAVIGSSATWQFRSVINYVWPVSDYTIGDTVIGSVSFTVAGADSDADDCHGAYPLDLTFTYTVAGVTHSKSARGYGSVTASCSGWSPQIQISINDVQTQTIFEIWDLFIRNEADTDVFPLTAPAVDMAYDHFRRYGRDGGPVEEMWGFSSHLFELTSGPVSKDDCKDGGWERFGFRNQGQCVRYVETGKDSR